MNSFGTHNGIFNIKNSVFRPLLAYLHHIKKKLAW